MEKLKVVQKCWGINWSKIDEGEYYGGYISPVYAETKGQAKTMLLSDASDYKTYNEEDITYLNIPVIRLKEGDKYNFNGDILTQREYEIKVEENKRKSKIDDIMNNKDITHCYIVKGGSYYAPNSCGYVSRQRDAGVYTKDKACQSAYSCNQVNVEPINIIEHNQLINDSILNLKSRLIE